MENARQTLKEINDLGVRVDSLGKNIKELQAGKDVWDRVITKIIEKREQKKNDQ